MRRFLGNRGARWGTALAVAAAFVPSCTEPSEIVLVVDTDMTAPADLDQVEILVSGPTRSAPAIVIDLSAPGAPTFPLTLGLTPGGGLSPLTVSVVATLQGAKVVEQTVRTAFAEGQSRLLRVLLLEACLPVTCASNQTCDSGTCGSWERPVTALPPWTGTVPQRPSRPPTVPIAGRTVWASGWHSSAVEGTSLFSWGQNSDGQLGTGDTQNAHARRPVMDVAAPISVGLGHLHSCICDATGAALCWGRNTEGQLGTGNTTASLIPMPVPNVADCLQITGGGSHTCMLRTGGAVSCWGQNGAGQVGQPAGSAPVTSPMTVPDLTDVAQIHAGERYTCARRSNGTVVCWGDNGQGQLGDGTTSSRASSAPVMGLTDIAEVATGRSFACARQTGGQVFCWGGNGGGVLGPGTTMNSSTPVLIEAMTDATQVAAGHQHACALRRSGVLSCWGGNQWGQLGNGTQTNSTTPVDVLDVTQVTSIAAGSVHTCARHFRGLACWGENLVNQLGDGSTTNRSRPVSVAGF